MSGRGCGCGWVSGTREVRVGWTLWWVDVRPEERSGCLGWEVLTREEGGLDRFEDGFWREESCWGLEKDALVSPVYMVESKASHVCLSQDVWAGCEQPCKRSDVEKAAQHRCSVLAMYTLLKGAISDSLRLLYIPCRRKQSEMLLCLLSDFPVEPGQLNCSSLALWLLVKGSQLENTLRLPFDYPDVTSS